MYGLRSGYERVLPCSGDTLRDSGDLRLCNGITDMNDETFFQIYPDRNYHIRKPMLELIKTKQRATYYAEECEAEFLSLGPHNKDRRRLILYRIPRDSPWYDPRKPPILKVPMLAFADESIGDDDAILAPILHGIMEDARERYG